MAFINANSTLLDSQVFVMFDSDNAFDTYDNTTLATLADSISPLTFAGTKDSSFGTFLKMDENHIVVTNQDEKYNNLDGYGANQITCVWIISLEQGVTSVGQVAIEPEDQSDSDDIFGYSVGIGHNRVVVGEQRDGLLGKAYVYDTKGNKLFTLNPNDKATETLYGRGFGRSVAIGDGRIAVAAWADDITSGSNSENGSVYLYDINGSYIRKFGYQRNRLSGVNKSGFYWGSGGTSFPTNFAYGSSGGQNLAIGSGRIVVGSPGQEFTQLVGNDVNSVGQVYIFDLNGNPLYTIRPTIAEADWGGSGDFERDTTFAYGAFDYFGEIVVVGCGRIVVGMGGYSSIGTDKAVAIFDLNGKEINTITDTRTNSDPHSWGDFLAIGDNRIAVGDPEKDRVQLYDIDGTLIQTISGTSSTQFGAGVAIKNGKLAIGAPENGTGKVFIYDLPQQSDIFDLVKYL